jgi:ferric-dicitrate binding protein FerR (iron transport regulator)
MTSRPSHDACDRALAALTREASDVPVPELDWDRIEANVLSVGATPLVPESTAAARASGMRWAPSAPTWASTPWPIAVAAAAAVALVLGGPSAPSRAPARSQEARSGAAQPRPSAILASLEVGDVTETDTRAALYDHPGVVSLGLAPNSRMEVVANDIAKQRNGGITIALSRGSIQADVNPRTEGEVFAVEVERTRIAVHGTSFTVSREGDRVIVDVAHGSVAVGPVGRRGSTHGWLVVGPDRAVFSLDGARAATWLAPPIAADATRTELAVQARSAADAPPSRTKRPSAVAITSPRADLAAGSTKGDATATKGAAAKGAWGEGSTSPGRDPSEQESSEVSAILRQLATCYEKQASAFGVRFSVASSLELTILPSGAIREGVFTPPLSPTLMSCADKAIGAARFPGGGAPRVIRIPVQLSRSAR